MQTCPEIRCHSEPFAVILSAAKDLALVFLGRSARRSARFLAALKISGSAGILPAFRTALRAHCGQDARAPGYFVVSGCPSADGHE